MLVKFVVPEATLNCRPADITAAARRLLFRRVFDLIGAPQGTLWWKTPHPDFDRRAPILRVYPRYDWVLHETVLNATPMAAVFRSFSRACGSATGAKEGDKQEGSTPAPGIATINPKAPVWECHDFDGSSSWWLALMYAQGKLEPPWILRYEEHFMHCPMCIYHIEIARLTGEIFLGESRRQMSVAGSHDDWLAAAGQGRGAKII